MAPHAFSGTSFALFEGFIWVRLRASKGWRQPKQDTRDNREHEGVHKRASVHSRAIQTRRKLEEDGRGQRNDSLRAERRKHNPKPAS